MKYFILFMVSILITIIGFSCVRIDEIEEAKLSVKQAIETFYQAQEEADLQTLISMYKQDSSIIALGAGTNDRLVGIVKIADSWRYHFEIAPKNKIWRRDENIQLNFRGDVAWITSINRMETQIDTQQITIHYHFSAVMEKIGKSWKFVQTHTSIPKNSRVKPGIYGNIPRSRNTEIKLAPNAVPIDSTREELNKNDSSLNSNIEKNDIIIQQKIENTAQDTSANKKIEDDSN